MINVQTALTDAAVPGVLQRELRRLTRAALEASGRTWHGTMRPWHFRPEAFARYPDVYRPRTAKYQARKRKRRGHNDPLVWSGQTQARSLQLVLRSTSQRVTVTLPGTRKLNRYNPHSRVRPAEELRAVGRGERRPLIRAARQELLRGIREVRATRRRR